MLTAAAIAVALLFAAEAYQHHARLPLWRMR